MFSPFLTLSKSASCYGGIIALVLLGPKHINSGGDFTQVERAL